MKKNEIILMSAMLFVALTACQKTPEACISADKSTAAINEEITFTSCSEDADENEFIVYDGTSITATSSGNFDVVGNYDPCTGNSITLKFKAAGTYTIQLIAKNRIRGDCFQGSYKSDKITTTVIITI